MTKTIPLRNGAPFVQLAAIPETAEYLATLIAIDAGGVVWENVRGSHGWSGWSKIPDELDPFTPTPEGP